jgi:hypothetical protein
MSFRTNVRNLFYGVIIAHYGQPPKSTPGVLCRYAWAPRRVSPLNPPEGDFINVLINK